MNADPAAILDLGLSQQLSGDLSAARATYQRAAEDLRRHLENLPPGSFEEAHMRAFLGAVYASLGEAQAAIVEGQEAMASHPTSKSPYGGAIIEAEVAEMYARLRDADHAVPLLKQLLQLPCGFCITPALLRLDPVWDPIRNDRRFQQLTLDKAR